jgi:hypothetical protein
MHTGATSKMIFGLENCWRRRVTRHRLLFNRPFVRWTGRVPHQASALTGFRDIAPQTLRPAQISAGDWRGRSESWQELAGAALASSLSMVMSNETRPLRFARQEAPMIQTEASTAAGRHDPDPRSLGQAAMGNWSASASHATIQPMQSAGRLAGVDAVRPGGGRPGAAGACRKRRLASICRGGSGNRGDAERAAVLRFI